MNKILVIDDEKDIRETLSGILGDEGYGVDVVGSGEEGVKYLEDGGAPDLILLDIWMPGMDGVETLKKIKELDSSIPVVMVSGHGNIDTAVTTTKLGAYDFLEKPLSLDKVILTVQHALDLKKLKIENMALREVRESKYTIIGESQVMESLQEDIKRAAPTNSWILITGENGTGKEYVARNIHLYSKRSDMPFVEVNCAAIPEDLIESELFGHEKGAFTGAGGQRKGKFDVADNGTIFLDEIGDMSLKTQAKVLRILQEQTFERVGGSTQISVDVRVIAATNKDLKAQIQDGTFREDLYYRLNVIPFHVPPLRDRCEDIPLFVNHYLDEFSRETGRDKVKVDKGVMALLQSAKWPGNVRELKNLIERLVIMTPSSTISVSDLPEYISGGEASSLISPSGELLNKTLKEARSTFERDFILKKLEECGGNISKTAEAIGLERSHLYRKIRDYGIEVS